MADRLPGARRDLPGVMGEIKRGVAAARRPTSAIRVGDWVLEARPGGLHITHGPSGTTKVLAEAPETEEAS